MKSKNVFYRILVVSSDRKVPVFVEENVAGKRCEIVWKKSFSTALKAIKSEKYDVCLLDARFGDSIALIAEIVSANQHPPVIFLLDNENDSLRIEALRSGVSCCLNKNILNEKLLEKAILYAVESGETLLKVGGSLVKFKDLIEMLPVMFFVCDPNPPYQPIYLSPEFETFGFSLEDWKNKTAFWQSIIHPDDLDRTMEAIGESLESGTTVDLQYRLIDSGGNVRWMNDYGYFIRDEKGKLVCWQGVLVDITKTKTAEDELRALFQSMTDVIFVVDKDGRYLRFAPTRDDLFFLPSEQLVGRTIHEVFPKEQADVFLNAVQAALKTGETQRIEYTLPIGERIVWFSTSFAQMTADTVIVVARDVSRQKETENELLALFQAMTDVIIVVDKDGRYLKIAPTNTSQFYLPPKEVIGKTLHEIFPAEQADEFLGYVRAAVESGEAQTFEYSLTIENQLIWFSATAAPLSDDTIILVARDISERKQAEEELKESEMKFRNIYENANDLIYVHDLQGNFLSSNQATERVIGYSLEEALKMNIADVLAPEFLEQAQIKLAEKMRGEAQTVYETECITKNGNRVTLEINSTIVCKDGKPVAVQGIARDVTERKEAENIKRLNEAKLKELFDHAPLGYHELDNEGRIVRVNQSELEMLGYEMDEMLGHFVWEFVVEEVSRQSVLAKLDGSKTLTPHERTFRKKDGSSILALMSDRLIEDENGVVTGIRTTVQNITELKRAEAALITSEEKYRLLGNGIMHQIWTAAPDGTLNYANQRVVEFFGVSPEEFLTDFPNLIHPEDWETTFEKWKYSISTGEDYAAEYRLRRHDGEYFWFQGVATAGRDAAGKIIGWFGTNTNIDDRKKAESQLTYLVGHDTLTGLANRSEFMNHLERTIQRSEFSDELRFAVLFLDIDRFKLINDSLGHHIGDKLLIEIAHRLKSGLRPNDVVARLGGDEFTVLVSNISQEFDAVVVAERFLELLSEPFKLNNYEVFTSASIGIVVSNDIHRQAEDFLRDADTAMYRAKTAGKNRFEIFDREMHTRNMNLLRIEIDLRRAIERNEFRVFYQPILELKTGEILEFEALIRWQHPEKGLVFPNDFIDIAEETGLIIPIGKLVLEEACRQTVEWQKQFPAHKNLSISVNLSAKQLMHPDLTKQVAEVLAKTKLAPQNLNLEVTESIVMEHKDKAASTMCSLKKLGVSLSTDDFGTGYSSLSYLHQFPFDCLKIDRSFVNKMELDEKSEAIVRTILLLAQNLNIEVVAEGIENEIQLESLCKLGCQNGQGYLFSKPVPAESASILLEQSPLEVCYSAVEMFAKIPESAQVQ